MPGDCVKVQGGLTVLWAEWMLAGGSDRSPTGHLNKAGLQLQLGKRQWSLESARKRDVVSVVVWLMSLRSELTHDYRVALSVCYCVP